MVASVFILIGNAVKNVLLMRIIFLIACIMFVVYGIYLHSISLVFLNGTSTIIHLVKIIQLKLPKQKK